MSLLVSNVGYGNYNSSGGTLPFYITYPTLYYGYVPTINACSYFEYGSHLPTVVLGGCDEPQNYASLFPIFGNPLYNRRCGYDAIDEFTRNGCKPCTPAKCPKSKRKKCKCV